MNIRNIAIIAHVDHGKTTLVDAMLKQTHTFGAHQKEMQQTLIMDSNDLEKERGITILAKNTSVFYNQEKINIIDTPGHADFGGEVERIINMASGALLLVDAAEGPLPQTRFVLKKALLSHLPIIVLINKIDKKNQRAEKVLHRIETLFLDLAHNEEALHFKTLYGVGRDGKVFYEKPQHYSSETPGDLTPLFETIAKHIPLSSLGAEKPFQMLISTLDYDDYVGRLCIGKVHQGVLKKGDKISLVENQKVLGSYNALKLFTSRGLLREEVEKITAGDIVALAGIPDLTIGQTVTTIDNPVSLPSIEIEPPTLKITLGPNTSSFSGREGKFTTSRQIKERLNKEMQTNMGLKIQESATGGAWIINGRGELHLAILIETMRREGFELEVSRPQVIYQKIDGQLCEPYEEVTIDVSKEYMGQVSEEFGKRKAEMIDMQSESLGRVTITYKISSQNLLGIRSTLMTNTRGTAVMNSYTLGYEPVGTKMDSVRSGALVAVAAGTSMTYGLVKAQERGTLFIKPQTAVYEGMVVGVSPRLDDIEVNVCREKKLTNNRSSGEGVSAPLEPATILSLEQCLDFLGDDELLEVTPLSLRLRKRHLTQTARRIANRKA